MDEDIELKLLMGDKFPVEDVGYLKSPKIRDIISIGYSRYNEILSALLFDKKNIQELRDIEDDNFHLLCFFFYQDKKFQESFSEGIKLLFESNVELVEVNSIPVLSLDSGQINSDNYPYIQKLIRISNNVGDSKEEDEYNAGNAKAREIIEKIKQGKANKPQKKPVVNLYSLISGLSWKSNSVNILNVFDLSIYQFYDGYYRLENIDHYNNTITGIYTGNIDSKKIKLQELNWAKIIK